LDIVDGHAGTGDGRFSAEQINTLDKSALVSDNLAGSTPYGDEHKHW
jgi:hypothetical protein